MQYTRSLLNHKEDFIRYIAKIAVNNDLSTLGQNVKIFCGELGIPHGDWNADELSKIDIKDHCSLYCKSTQNESHASVLRELCSVRDRTMQCELSETEINCIILDILCFIEAI
jgi:hypothetical protein